MASADRQMQFTKSQAITASAASQDKYYAGPLHGDNAKIALQQPGGTLGIVVVVETEFDSANDTATLTTTWQTDSDEAFGSPTNVFKVTDLATVAQLTKGAMFHARIPDGQQFELWNRLYFTAGTQNFTAGVLSAYGVLDITRWTAHAVGAPPA